MNQHQHIFVRDTMPMSLDDFTTEYGQHCRKRDAIQAVRDRFYREWMRISHAMEDEIRRIEREGV